MDGFAQQSSLTAAIDRRRRARINSRLFFFSPATARRPQAGGSWIQPADSYAQRANSVSDEMDVIAHLMHC